MGLYRPGAPFPPPEASARCGGLPASSGQLVAKMGVSPRRCRRRGPWAMGLHSRPHPISPPPTHTHSLASRGGQAMLGPWLLHDI